MNRRRLKQFLLVVFLSPGFAYAQLNSVENSVFWEISGNGLKESSFLFGSHHLLGGEFLDSLKNVITKFDQCKTFVNEISYRGTDASIVASAAIMKDSTLDQLLPPEWFFKTENWLAELSEYNNLYDLKNLYPVTIEVMIMSLLQVQVYGKVEMPMDAYMEEKALSQEKKMIALESLEQQLQALFHSMTLKRQAESLIGLVTNKDLAIDELIRFNLLYRKQELSALESYSLQKYQPKELDLMLYDRNARWVSALPSIFEEQSAFVIVGALHLTGTLGLVTQLRSLGYTVTPIATN